MTIWYLLKHQITCWKVTLAICTLCGLLLFCHIVLYICLKYVCIFLTHLVYFPLIVVFSPKFTTLNHVLQWYCPSWFGSLYLCQLTVPILSHSTQNFHLVSPDHLSYFCPSRCTFSFFKPSLVFICQIYLSLCVAAWYPICSLPNLHPCFALCLAAVHIASWSNTCHCDKWLR